MLEFYLPVNYLHIKKHLQQYCHKCFFSVGPLGFEPRTTWLWVRFLPLFYFFYLYPLLLVIPYCIGFHGIFVLSLYRRLSVLIWILLANYLQIFLIIFTSKCWSCWVGETHNIFWLFLLANFKIWNTTQPQVWRLTQGELRKMGNTPLNCV